MSQTFAAGAIRHRDQDGRWIVTEPRDPMYSTATMVATEWWDSKTHEWRQIFDDEEGA